MKLLLTLHCVLVLFLNSPQIYAEIAKVAVAANFKLAAEELRIVFEQQSGQQLKLIRASTGVLYNQIIHGAPYDLFLSADDARPKLLEKQKLAVPGSRFTYALGQLVLVYRHDSILSASDLVKLFKPGTTLAIANPKTAPYGNCLLYTSDAADE